jgi:hypothetical protein
MKTIQEGHEYLLANTNGEQTLSFLRKEATGEKDGELEIAEDGTTNEEVLKMLINRFYFLQKQNACRENSIVITKLEESLMWLEKRTVDRVARNVEGTLKA